MATEPRDIIEIINKAIVNYKGDSSVLGSAIGAFHIGLKVGWRPLRLMHSHKTFVRYQQILDLDFMQVLPEIGPLANKSVGWRLIKRAGDFWDAVRGTLPGRSRELI